MTITNDDPRQIFRFRLRSFKKNNADLELRISASSIVEAWAEARRRAQGFPYYLQAIVTTPKPQQKSSPKGLPKKPINE